MCAVYTCIGSDAMKVAGILRSAQNDSTVQDPIDQYTFAGLLEDWGEVPEKSNFSDATPHINPGDLPVYRYKMEEFDRIWFPRFATYAPFLRIKYQLIKSGATPLWITSRSGSYRR